MEKDVNQTLEERASELLLKSLIGRIPFTKAIESSDEDIRKYLVDHGFVELKGKEEPKYHPTWKGRNFAYDKRYELSDSL